MNYGINAVAIKCSENISSLDIVSNNLANVATPGFKVEHIYADVKNNDDDSTISLSYPLLKSIDYSQGILQMTGNPLDMAIQGEGFFVVQTLDGPAYTRRGNFTVNSSHQLITQAGEQVLGEKGPITLSGKVINIDKLGNVSVDEASIDKLRVVRFDNIKALIRRGEGSFSNPGEAGMKKMDQPDINQRYLESSNVNPMMEMTSMINIQRVFESYQKVIQTIADLDKLSTSRVGKLA